MKKRIFSVLFALVLVLSLSLVPSVALADIAPEDIETDTSPVHGATDVAVDAPVTKTYTSGWSGLVFPGSAGGQIPYTPDEADALIYGSISGDLSIAGGDGFSYTREDSTNSIIINHKPFANGEVVTVELQEGLCQNYVGFMEGKGNRNSAYGAWSFTVAPALTAITVDDPDGGEFVSGTHTVKWSYTGRPAPDSGITLAYTTGLGWTNFKSLQATSADYPSQSCEWDTTALPDGPNYQIRVSYDPNPAINDMSDAVFTVDNTNPVVEVTSPNGGEEWAGEEEYEITWTATDTNMASDPITIEYWDGDSWEAVATGEANDGTYSWEVPKDNIAAAKVKVTAVDEAGNSGSDESAVFVIDSTVPDVELTAPADSAYINEDSCEVTATATDNGATMEQVVFSYSLNEGASWVSIGDPDTSSPYGVTWDVSELSDKADIQVKAVASDVAGNDSEAAVNTGITLDRANPVVTLTAPLDNGYINDTTYAVTATAIDATAGVNQVQFFYSLDGTTWDSIGTDTDTADDSYSVSWDLNGITEQAGIQLKATATDKADKSGSDGSTGVTFDKTAPSTPTVTAVATPGKVTLDWTTASTDALSGLDHYNIYRSDDSFSAAIGQATAAETSYIDTTATPGETYTYKVGAVDMAGNEATSGATSSVTFMAEVTVSIDAPDSVYLGQVFAVDVDITEVTDFDAASFDVTFRSAYLTLTGVDNGLIGGETLFVSPKRAKDSLRIVINLAGTTGANGAGTLATLHFEAIQLTPSESPTAIGLSNGCLSNIAAEAIVANWLKSDSLEINVLRGDANSDATLDSRDITKVERIIAGVDDQTPGADANGDSVYDARDITQTELFVAGV